MRWRHNNAIQIDMSNDVRCNEYDKITGKLEITLYRQAWMHVYATYIKRCMVLYIGTQAYIHAAVLTNSSLTLTVAIFHLEWVRDEQVVN